ncbi:MAG: YcaO-like family protein [Rhodoplanes sp.]|uniref:YcaO-like family protein n=1 Tax=Rhodoplanes sp. TaxID=1968906 RepID=UPI0018338351|nr:YcaO-like family protein [Rhodoplanes sp.]NVO17780.1 YcaO-like family protein [Rhodoplanes sp.]
MRLTTERAGNEGLSDPIAISALSKYAVLNGSRVISPAQTWSRIEPILADFGITRVGDITGLDRIGIPVWIAVRPNARTLSASQGKGPDHAAARVSAAMEALEIAHAEQPGLAVRYATVSEISAAGDVVDVTDLPRPRGTLLGTKTAIPWTTATDWKSRASVWVPYEIVHADATVPRLDGSGCFLHSTNGLSSGNILEEAMLHGLCEVIERDALAILEHAPPEHRAERRLDPWSVDDPVACRLLDQVYAADVVPIIWDASSDVGVATIRVALYDNTSDPVTRPLPASLGAGCHPDRTVALCRAVTEAAQSRLTAIAGSRDDLGRARYRDAQSADALMAHRATAQDPGGRRSFASVPTRVGDTVAADLAWVIGQLERVALARVLFVDMGRAGMPFSVVRVIVPGLEGPTDSPSYVPGRRARGSRRQAAP